MVTLLKKGVIVEPEFDFWFNIDNSSFLWVSNREVPFNESKVSQFISLLKPLQEQQKLIGHINFGTNHLKVVTILNYASRGMIISDQVCDIEETELVEDPKFVSFRKIDVRTTEILFSDIKVTTSLFATKNKDSSKRESGAFTLDDTDKAWKVVLSGGE